jgi:hypothetical protein
MVRLTTKASASSRASLASLIGLALAKSAKRIAGTNAKNKAIKIFMRVLIFTPC